MVYHPLWSDTPTKRHLAARPPMLVVIHSYVFRARQVERVNKPISVLILQCCAGFFPIRKTFSRQWAKVKVNVVGVAGASLVAVGAGSEALA
jgi:hypothetical protein